MTAQLLSRQTHRAPNRPCLTVLKELQLALGRVHEIAGPARRSLAALIAAGTQGPIFWIQPAWQKDALNADGLCRLFHPGRLTFLEPERAEDLLWTMEELLRSGEVPLVVAELERPPSLTPVRRLNLASEHSGRTPLGLILTPDMGGAAGVETRWHMAPSHDGTECLSWQLRLLRARMAPQQTWQLRAQNGRMSLSKEHFESATPIRPVGDGSIPPQAPPSLHPAELP